jgi:protein-arginine kinase activator protein McsA
MNKEIHFFSFGYIGIGEGSQENKGCDQCQWNLKQFIDEKRLSIELLYQIRIFVFHDM